MPPGINTAPPCRLEPEDARHDRGLPEHIMDEAAIGIIHAQDAVALEVTLKEVPASAITSHIMSEPTPKPVDVHMVEATSRPSVASR